MALLERLLPADTDLGLSPDRLGPVRAADFELWELDDDNPMELIEGWVVPMNPGDFFSGELTAGLTLLVASHARAKGFRYSLDARHRLPQPPETVVFPDIAVHCAEHLSMHPGSRTVTRVPDLVIELLSEKMAERDRAPRGAKFRAYEMSGVREYFYAWPDGREAAGFRLEAGTYVAIAPDAEGYFASAVLDARLRLVPASLLR